MNRGARTTTTALLAAALLATALLAACAGDGSTLGPDGRPLSDSGEDSTAAVTLSQLSAQIFTPKCAIRDCHGGPFVSENMSLEADRIAAATIGVASNQMPALKRIDPGNPDGSYLLRKVRGTGAGKQMPLERAPLSAEEIALIVAWVEAGAAAE